MNTKISGLTTLRTYTFCTSASDVLTLFDVGSATVRGILTRPNSSVVDFTVWLGITPPVMYTFRMAISDNAITYRVKFPTRPEVDALNNNLSVALLPSDADANASTYRSAGFHMYAGAFSNDRTNFPSDFKGGVFIDVGTADMHWQFCCNYNSASVLYFRNYYSSWNTWKLLTNV